MSAPTAELLRPELLRDDAQAPIRLERPGSADNRLLYADPSYFTAEQAALRDAAWHFVGTTDELVQNNEWVRADAFGCDLFVQNVGGELRGFLNVCQHRGFPIRREASGRGPILCGFHAWRYDGEGRLVGVARNEELYAMPREERADRSLVPMRVEAAGPFVFAAASGRAPALADYLGRTYALLLAVGARKGAMRHRWAGEVQANWKLYYEITLDDYHVAFVHPGSLGADVRDAKFLTYERSGAHSRMFARRTDDWNFPGFWDAVGRGEYEFAGYKIHHFFPNLFLVAGRDQVLLTRLTPIAADRTGLDDWVFEVTGNPRDDAGWDEYVALQRRVSAEDQDACTAQQRVIADFGRAPVYGRLEQRLAWFHDSYEELVGAPTRARLTGEATGRPDRR